MNHRESGQSCSSRPIRQNLNQSSAGSRIESRPSITRNGGARSFGSRLQTPDIGTPDTQPHKQTQNHNYDSLKINQGIPYEVENNTSQEKEKNSDRVIGSILLLCIVLCISFMFTIRASKYIDRDFSENEGIGAVVNTLREIILNNEDIAAFLGLSGIPSDNKNDDEQTDTKDNTSKDDSGDIDKNEAVAVAVQQYIERYNSRETSSNRLPSFPLDGIITSFFSMRQNPFYQVSAGENAYEFHSGIDISAAKSTDILAYDDGIVSLVSFSAGYGNYLIITHQEEFQTLYAHCDKIIVMEGQSVKGGEHVAVAGNTGRSTAKHLHFEIRINGKAVNPLPYLPEPSGISD